MARSLACYLEPVVGALRVVDGARMGGVPGAAAPAPPSHVIPDRRSESLFVLLDLAGSASSRLHRELREVAAQTYWASEGSITSALRQAATAANRHLFQFNLHASPPDRCYGGLACAVLRGNDLFVLLAGPVRGCVLREGCLDRFPRDGESRQLGVGPLADERVYHAFIGSRDTLLLSSSILIQETGDGRLKRVLLRSAIEEVMEGLEQLGAAVDFVALVARPALPSLLPRHPRQQPLVSSGTAAVRSPEGPRPLRPRERPSSRPEPAEPPVETPMEVQAPPREQAKSQKRVARRIRAKPPREPEPGLGERMSALTRRVRGGAASAGRGVAGTGRRLAGSVGAVFRSMLPGPGREARRRARSPRVVPKENRAVMMSFAVGVPVVVAAAVVLAYGSFGVEARFQGLVDRARQEVALAQAGDGGASSRAHWEIALEYATRAVDRRPEDQDAVALERQARAALDLFDGVVRLEPIHLQEFGGAGDDARRLAVHGQMIFVLDPVGEWVVRVTLDQAGTGLLEQGLPYPLVRTGQEIDDGEVGDLLDLAWVGSERERKTSGLLIVEKEGALVGYDPAWGSEGESVQLARSFLGTPPPGEARAAGAYEGRLYVLDPVARQVWRYEPRGDVYPDPPDRYFVTPPPRSLETALDIAIDGNVYVLYEDGTVLKFRDRDPQPFEVHGVPGDIKGALSLAVDPSAGSGLVYVADRGGGVGGRVVVLGPDGAFRAQFRAEGALDGLEALNVDEAAGRLYLFSGGHLYVAPLPPLP